MPRGFPLRTAALLVVLAASIAVARPAAAVQVWSGRTFAFAKANGADWTQPVNQDRITPTVWLTRKSTQGLYNIAQEAGYLPTSPGDTEWATGDAVNWPSLTFQSWVDWAANFPPGTVGVNAVVHLITDDIYIDIRFDSWTSVSGGGFSYHRGVPGTTPVGSTTWGRIKSLYR